MNDEFIYLIKLSRPKTLRIISAETAHAPFASVRRDAAGCAGTCAAAASGAETARARLSLGRRDRALAAQRRGAASAAGRLPQLSPAVIGRDGASGGLHQVLAAFEFG